MKKLGFVILTVLLEEFPIIEEVLETFFQGSEK
jgi:hypothetical protein